MGQSKDAKRLARTSLVVPLCVGNTSIPLPKAQIQGDNTHSWVVYVRSPTNADLSHVISKVSFTLHTSFRQPVREVTEPPYQVQEHGWGEFEILIKIEFRADAAEGPFKTAHKLKLFEDEEPQNREASSRGIVLREVYDELVFWEPTEAFYSRIKDVATEHNAPGPTVGFTLPRYSEEEELQRLEAARNRIAGGYKTGTA